MNKVTLIGRTTKDIELRYTKSNKAVASFILAVDRRSKDDGADFISCVVWGNTAEAMNNYVHKGNKVAIFGHIATRSYDKDGQKVYITEVVADEVEFLEKREQKQSNGFVELDDDEGDLPF